MNLRGLDLNLLVALDALLREKSVTRAAERVHISQPGMSAALHKLRIHFSDRLLQRAGRNLELTPCARELAGPIGDILTQLRVLVDFRPNLNTMKVGSKDTERYCYDGKDDKARRNDKNAIERPSL